LCTYNKEIRDLYLLDHFSRRAKRGFRQNADKRILKSVLLVKKAMKVLFVAGLTDDTHRGTDLQDDVNHDPIPAYSYYLGVLLISRSRGGLNSRGIFAVT